MTDERPPRPPGEPDLDVAIEVREWWPSSNIAGVGYDAETLTLEVRFGSPGGRVTAYRYGAVLPQHAAPLLTERPDPELLKADGGSPGKYLSRVFVKNPKLFSVVKLGDRGTRAGPARREEVREPSLPGDAGDPGFEVGG